MNCKKHENWEKINTKSTKQICKSQATFFLTTQHQLENEKKIFSQRISFLRSHLETILFNY